MAKGSHKAYPRFHADVEIISLVDFIEAFARRDASIPKDAYLKYTPIIFSRILEIAVEQNRLAIAEGTKTDFMMRGRGILEGAIIETGLISGAQKTIDWQLDVGMIDELSWQRCSYRIAEEFEIILLRYAQQSAFFLRDLETNIGRKGKLGRPSVTQAAFNLERSIDSGLLKDAAQPTRDDPENSFTAMMRRLRPIVRNHIADGILPRHDDNKGQSIEDALDRHMKRLKRLAEAIHAEHLRSTRN